MVGQKEASICKQGTAISVRCGDSTGRRSTVVIVHEGGFLLLRFCAPFRVSHIVRGGCLRALLLQCWDAYFGCWQGVERIGLVGPWTVFSRIYFACGCIRSAAVAMSWVSPRIVSPWKLYKLLCISMECCSHDASCCLVQQQVTNQAQVGSFDPAAASDCSMGV